MMTSHLLPPFNRSVNDFQSERPRLLRPRDVITDSSHIIDEGQVLRQRSRSLRARNEDAARYEAAREYVRVPFRR